MAESWIASRNLAQIRGVGWAFALTFAAITVVSALYLFIIPIVFSAAITVCLIMAAWLSSIASQQR